MYTMRIYTYYYILRVYSIALIYHTCIALAAWRSSLARDAQRGSPVSTRHRTLSYHMPHNA